MVSLNFSEEGDKGVATSLSKLELKTETLSMIKKERELWLVFGKMNSNLYRGELMTKMVAKGLSGESMLMV